MGKERPKAERILESAMAILREHGDHGLTMRKVADASGISLGHLQHYFATRNDMLKALVGCHFEQCTETLSEHIRAQEHAGREARVDCVVALGFAYVSDEASGRVCREFWALSSRNEEVREHLDGFYRAYCDMLTAFLAPVACTAEGARAATAMLMPWFEGYNVTARSIGMDKEAMARHLAELVLRTLGSDAVA